MNSVTAALVAGLVAGLALAVPMGAISVLLVAEALQRGFRHASAAATGVALVDFCYAALATVAGAAVTRALDGHTRAVQLTGAAVLVAVAVRGLLGLRTARTADGAGTEPAPAGSPGALLLRFVGLTVINPLTAVYFVVLAAGLGSTLAGWRAGTAFVAGVFAASWAWQLTLVGTASLVGARLPGWARTATGLVGYVVVLGYAGRLAAG